MSAPAVDDDLLALLACPSPDHAPLERGGTAAAPTLVCTVCASSFPVRDGIPVLLPDDATPGPRGLGVPATDAAGGAEGAATGDPAGEPAAP